MAEARERSSHYLWLCLAMTGVVFLGFTFTYFGPMLSGEYPKASPAVHVHGWTFFAWYLLLPLQAGLIAFRRISVHRLLGKASVALAVLMVGTGLVVIGAQMEATRQPDPSPFWQFMGLAVFSTLVLFVVFYTLAFRYRRNRELHKRLILLASAGALGAAAFRVVGRAIGFGPMAGVIGIFVPNLIVLAAILIELKRGEGVHKVYRVGLPLTLLLECGAFLATPTAVGQAAVDALAAVGRLLAPLY